MCEFISWKQKGDWVAFLTDDDLATPAGKDLIEFLGTQCQNDIKGHGAIAKYYELSGWQIPEGADDRECTDFSTPENFPALIVKAIKAGKFRGIEMLNAKIVLTMHGQKAYADRQKADADYQKAYVDRQKADADYQKAYVDWQKADADWLKAEANRQKAYVDWQKTDADRQKAYVDWQKTDADYQKAYVDWQKTDADRQKAYVDWQKTDVDWQKADADWLKAEANRQKAYVDCQKTDADRQKAYVDCQKTDTDIFWDIFADPANRKRPWR